MMKFTFSGKNLLNEKKEIIYTFPHKIEKLEQIKDKAFVLTVGLEDRAHHSDYVRNNVWCFDAKGNLLWQIETIKSAVQYDSYSTMILEGGKLIAYTGSGIRCEVDMESGKILTKEFTK